MSPRWKIVLPLAALALIPGAAVVRAAAESDTYKQLDQLMDVFERVRVDYVDKTDDKKLIDAGEVEKVKKEAREAFDQQLAAMENKHKPVATERDSLKNELHQEKLGGAFGRSKFIADKLAIPVDLVQHLEHGVGQSVLERLAAHITKWKRSVHRLSRELDREPALFWSEPRDVRRMPEGVPVPVLAVWCRADAKTHQFIKLV